jgi:phage regulator Rha-like protein
MLPEKMPIIRRDGARVLTNSRDVAAFFEKRHDDVFAGHS